MRPPSKMNLTLCKSSLHDSELGLGIDVHGIHIISLATRFRTATRSSTLADGFAKIRSPRSCDHVTLHAVAGAWSAFMLHRSTSFSTKKAHIFVCRLDYSGVFVGSPPHKMQRAATALLCKVEQKRDFSRHIAKRATKVIGPISRHRISSILPVIRSASRVTLPGLASDIIQIMCVGLCASRRSMLKTKTNILEQGTKMGLIVFAITTSAHASQPFAPSSGGLQVFGSDTSSHYTTSSYKPRAEVSNMGSLYRAS